MADRGVLGLLGLAKRAGCLCIGEQAVLEKIRKGNAHLVVMAEDAGPNTTKRMADKCRSYGVPLVRFQDRFTLGHAVGREGIVVLAVTDRRFAEGLLAKLRQHYGGDNVEPETPRVRIRQTNEHVE
ncbi:MAG: ribosomal L7Ae/L30e/S12e/Gadd45 family protein [Alicyclobacillaceae bacterium]|nr:ribosomal L7Ae/L30e/S12e/Gadd45 family protein [Alicyclobacillaceae bacterium]